MSFLISANLLPICVHFGLDFVWLNAEWWMSSGSFLHANLICIERLLLSTRARRYLTLSFGLPVNKLTREFFCCFIQCCLSRFIGSLDCVAIFNALWAQLAKFSFKRRVCSMTFAEAIILASVLLCGRSGVVSLLLAKAETMMPKCTPTLLARIKTIWSSSNSSGMRVGLSRTWNSPKRSQPSGVFCFKLISRPILLFLGKP